ncbi:MAG: hypothetical protein WD995_10085 [Gemmatimonadota bacterium]
MSARFRIRTPQGQELSFGSEEMFADFVKSGELSSGDLVYDATTGEWSPALTHSLVLEFQSGGDDRSSEGEDAHVSEPGSEALSGGGEETVTPSESGAPTDDGADLGFQLAPEQTPEEAAAAFVKEMEAEREAEFERRQELKGLKSDESGTGLLREIERTPPEPPSGQTPSRGQDAWSGEDARAPESTYEAPAPRRKSARRASSPRRRGRGISGRFVFWALTFGVVGVGVLLGPDLIALAGVNTEGADVGEVDTGAPILPDTEEALRARADVRFLSRVLQSFAALPAIPNTWLDGRYLANASEYPGVRAAWVAYLEAIRRVRVDEDEYYSAAYLSALDDARVTGATRTLRLASALSRFESEGAERQAHYDRVAELATAAIDLHDLLVEREASITYEPAVGTRISADPILQAAGTDPETQQLLEAALDRVLDALSERQVGPVEASRVPDWMFEGLRDVVAPE